MSAEVLRQAAALMRKRAERVVKDDPNSAEGWYANLQASGGLSWVNDREGHLISAHGMPYHVEHIASWHPAVALAVADLLDTAADHFDPGGEFLPVYSEALLAARTYLGSDA